MTLYAYCGFTLKCRFNCNVTVVSSFFSPGKLSSSGSDSEGEQPQQLVDPEQQYVTMQMTEEQAQQLYAYDENAQDYGGYEESSMTTAAIEQMDSQQFGDNDEESFDPSQFFTTYPQAEDGGEEVMEHTEEGDS